MDMVRCCDRNQRHGSSTIERLPGTVTTVPGHSAPPSSTAMTMTHRNTKTGDGSEDERWFVLPIALAVAITIAAALTLARSVAG